MFRWINGDAEQVFLDHPDGRSEDVTGLLNKTVTENGNYRFRFLAGGTTASFEYNLTMPTATATATVNVTARKTDRSVSLSGGSFTYGDSVGLSSSTNGDGVPSYTIVSGPGTLSGGSLSASSAGAIRVRVDYPETDTFTAGSAEADFTVNRRDRTVTLDGGTLTYGDSLLVTSSTNGDGSPSYSVEAGPGSLSGSSLSATGIGAVRVRVAYPETGGYAAGSAEVVITVIPRGVRIILADQDFTYDGFAKVATYSVSDAAATLTADVSRGPEAGLYTVSVSAFGNYTGSATATLRILPVIDAFTLNPAAAPQLSISASPEVSTYGDGNSIITWSTTGGDHGMVTGPGLETPQPHGTHTLERPRAGAYVYSATAHAADHRLSWQARGGSQLVLHTPAGPVNVSGRTDFTTRTPGDYRLVASAPGVATSSATLFAPAPAAVTAQVTVRINPAPLTAIPVATTVTYGDDMPTSVSVTYEGWKYHDGASPRDHVQGQPRVRPAETVRDAGVHSLVTEPGSFASSNYTFVPGVNTLTVLRAPLTILPTPVEIDYGEPLPRDWPVEYSGWRYEDGATPARYLAGAPKITTAGDPRNAGDYTVIAEPGSLSSGNYRFSGARGRLTIRPAPLTATPKDLVLTYGDPLPESPDVAYSGWKYNDEIDRSKAMTGAPSVEVTSAWHDVGTYALRTRPGSFASTNYRLVEGTGRLTVQPAPLVVQPKNRTMIYGDSVSRFDYDLVGWKYDDGRSPSRVASGLPDVVPQGYHGDTGLYSLVSQPGSFSSANYRFVSATATLQVNHALPVASFEDKVLTAEDRVSSSHLNALWRLSNNPSFRADVPTAYSITGVASVLTAGMRLPGGVYTVRASVPGTRNTLPATRDVTFYVLDASLGSLTLRPVYPGMARVSWTTLAGSSTTLAGTGPGWSFTETVDPAGTRTFESLASGYEGIYQATITVSRGGVSLSRSASWTIQRAPQTLAITPFWTSDPESGLNYVWRDWFHQTRTGTDVSNGDWLSRAVTAPSGLPISWASDAPTRVHWADGTLRAGENSGLTRLTASVAGDGNWLPGSTSVEFELVALPNLNAAFPDKSGNITRSNDKPSGKSIIIRAP